MTHILNAEKQFYSRYDWCLNPALSVQDLFRRLQEELARYRTLDGWQREESRANLYLFTCAIACTADDYLGLRWLNLSALSNRFPQLRRPITAAQMVIDVSQSAMKIGDHAAWRWRRRWDKSVEAACRLLLCPLESESDTFEQLRRVSSDLSLVRLPEPLLKRRMRLPEAFRSQDMAHQDVITLIRRFCDSFSPSDQPAVIMGLRTAGAYFAPLMAEYLKMHQWPHVFWFSIRPKNGVARWEKRQLISAARKNARLLLVDDYPSSGGTLKMTLSLLGQFGIRPERVVILAPTHPAQPDWVRLAGVDGQTGVVTIDESDLHKNAVLAPEAVERLCNAYFTADGWEEARVVDDVGSDKINSQFAQHLQDGHHVREKRVFALELSGRDGKRVSKKVFFKSVGWGWLGYHAYIAGTRLEGFVPRIIGLRNGLLLTDWIDNTSPNPEARDGGMVPVLASYVAARSRRLRLSGDCRFESRTYRWTGSDEIINILRAVYGPYINRLKTPVLRKELQKYVTAVPTLVDGRMRPEEWIHTPAKIYKADFEHHNFGGGELDIVDPAYDLAAASFEFGLSKEAEQELLRNYARESGDFTIRQRILLHKILYGTIVAWHSLDSIALGKEPEQNNVRYHAARNFLVYSMANFCARLAGSTKPTRWSESLFFLDLDGVFDHELLGFPHATASGLQSLALLKSHGFSVVLNTGRSVQDVRHYCDAYGLPGGVAEFGAVFVDAVNRREVPLIDGIGAEQLARCREAMKQLPGVFIDPCYEYSIRACRYTGRRSYRLDPAELETLLRNPQFSHLDYVCRDSDSYIVQRSASKAAALRFVVRSLGGDPGRVTAIGDSEYDIEMLKAARFAYAPGSCSPLVRELAKRGQCRIVQQHFQPGLLTAVRHRLGQEAIDRSADLPNSFGSADHHLNTLMQAVLKAADRGMVFQLLIALSWWTL